MIKLGNGIDQSLIKSISSFKYPVSNFNLLYIGNFSAHKSLETLFAAMKLLPNKYTLTIAGNHTLHPLHIPPKVKVITNFPDSQLASIIDRADILISPSIQESFGLVLLEAMARGRPVIAADIPASVELINKSHAGLIFKQNDPTDLAHKITIIKPNKNGPAFASLHTWDRIGESLWQRISSS